AGDAGRIGSIGDIQEGDRRRTGHVSPRNRGTDTSCAVWTGIERGDCEFGMRMSIRGSTPLPRVRGGGGGKSACTEKCGLLPLPNPPERGRGQAAASGESVPRGSEATAGGYPLCRSPLD